ncbi:unnamed protein product [Soboliphyme baturini]|uniref:CUB domain-containing protein n=1 Tax=Soboliphyme baturini TaxID=241478 RepID=A0A183IQ14_9BILA|nr:unnamed protein product [Soboliphyme baturini]
MRHEEDRFQKHPCCGLIRGKQPQRQHEANVSLQHCDKMYIQLDQGPVNGTFSSPDFPSNYPRNLQCIYTFIAKPTQRVRLKFTDFQLTGNALKCEDHIDIYAELEKPDVERLVHHQMIRYCGTISPQIRISLHNVIVIVFHVRENSAGAKGFHGTYSFIPKVHKQIKAMGDLSTQQHMEDASRINFLFVRATSNSPRTTLLLNLVEDRLPPSGDWIPMRVSSNEMRYLQLIIV